MPIGYGSAAVNAQLVPVPVTAAFDPLTFGQAYTGPGMWPRQGVYNVPPVLPAGSRQQWHRPLMALAASKCQPQRVKRVTRSIRQNLR
jgi:hypothetical protein